MLEILPLFHPSTDDLKSALLATVYLGCTLSLIYLLYYVSLPFLMPKKKLIRMNGIFEACLCFILVRLVFQPTHSNILLIIRV